MFVLQIRYKSFLNVYSFCKKNVSDHKKHDKRRKSVIGRYSLKRGNLENFIKTLRRYH